MGGEARHLQPRRRAGLGERGEIDPGGDVLQAGPKKRVAVRVMAVVAAQAAHRTVGMQQLRARQAVVDEQQQAGLEHIGERGHPGREPRVELAAAALGQRHPDGGEIGEPLRHRRDEARIARTSAVGGARAPLEARHVVARRTRGTTDAEPPRSTAAHHEALTGQRVDHLVGEQHAAERRGQRIEPARRDAAYVDRRLVRRGEQRLLTRAQVGADLEQ